MEKDEKSVSTAVYANYILKGKESLVTLQTELDHLCKLFFIKDKCIFFL